MLSSPSLQLAFAHACHARMNRRILAIWLDQQDCYWWGGHIDKWRAPPGLFPSAAAADQCFRFIHRFRQGLCPKGRMLLIHQDGMLGAILLGIESQQEAQQWLNDAIAVHAGQSMPANSGLAAEELTY